jgi:isochorismate pyruvate lyase
MNSPDEPAVRGGAVRRFKDPAYSPVAANLGELREQIDALDEQMVALLAQRALRVRDATRFKRDAFQASAPARQAQVFERVRGLARRHEASFPDFPGVVDATYRAMVGAFVAGETQLLNQTELLEP